jgi:hypothetical protein
MDHARALAQRNDRFTILLGPPDSSLRNLKVMPARVLNECSRQHRHRTSTGWAKWARVFMLIPAFGPNSDRLPSPFGQGAGVP